MAKWASEHMEGWRIEEWEMTPLELRLDLRKILDEDKIERDDR